MSDTPRFETFPLGPFETNCYVVSAPNRHCWIIDAGFAPEVMLDYIRDERLEPQRLILTHAHADHVAGVGEVAAAFPGLPIEIHESERDVPADASKNLSLLVGQPVVSPDPTGTIDHGDELRLGELSFEVRHTPGHSPGGITLYCSTLQWAFVGDTLFAGSIGRFDFPTSDGPALIRSIHEQLLTLPDDTRVMPGHGPETTIGRERQSNPYLRETPLSGSR